MRFLLAVLVCLSFVADADACSRCGFRICRLVKPVQVVAAPIIADSPDIFILNNNYPSPLVGQGTSALVSNGGYQSSVYALHDPRIAMSGAIEVTKAAQLMVSSSLDQTLQANERLSQIYAPAVEVSERGAASERILNAAGLNPAYNTQRQQSFLFSVGPNGIESKELTYEQTQSIVARAAGEVHTNITKPPAAEAPQAAQYSFVSKFCGKCHGLDNPSPSKGFYIGLDSNVAEAMDHKYRVMENMVKSGEMPKGTSLTDEEKAQVLVELNAMIEDGLSQSVSKE